MNGREVLGTFFVFLSGILFGIVSTILVSFVSIFLPLVEVFIFESIVLFGGLGLLVFLSFKSLNLERINLLILTLAMSFFVCIAVFAVHDAAGSFQDAVSEFFEIPFGQLPPPAEGELGGAPLPLTGFAVVEADPFLGDFAEPVREGWIMLAVVLGLNLLPVVNVFRSSER